MFNIYTGSLIVFTVGVLMFRKKLSMMYTLFSISSRVILENWVKEKARELNLISGEKIIDDLTDSATISYQNSRGKICKFKVPFYRQNVKPMKDKKVILFTEADKDIGHLVQEGLGKSNSTDYINQLSTVLKRKEGTFIRYDITQEPGLPYLLSPKQLGGHKICIYQVEEGKTWASEFLLEGKPLITVVGDEKLPTFFIFALMGKEREEEEILC